MPRWLLLVALIGCNAPSTTKDPDSPVDDDTDSTPPDTDNPDTDPPDDTDPSDDTDPLGDDTDPSDDTDPPGDDTDDSDPIDTDPIDTDPLDTDLGAWSHTINVDGDPVDWLPDEAVPSASSSEAWFTWDDTDLFIGVRHPDIGSGGPLHWVVITLGAGPGGGTEGLILGTQLPALDYRASHILQWKADNSYSRLGTWTSGASAVDPDWQATTGGALA